jgi:hypothetical protein
MNIQELQNTLLKRGMRPNAVSFQTGVLTAAEQYCIAQENGIWDVYYFERGNKNDLRHFPDENSACNYLSEVLLRDKVIK